MLDFTFYDLQNGHSPVRVTPYMSHGTDTPSTYEDEVAFAAMEMGYIAGPSLNTAHHPKQQ